MGDLKFQKLCVCDDHLEETTKVFGIITKQFKGKTFLTFSSIWSHHKENKTKIELSQSCLKFKIFQRCKKQ